MFNLTYPCSAASTVELFCVCLCHHWFCALQNYASGFCPVHFLALQSYCIMSWHPPVSSVILCHQWFCALQNCASGFCPVHFLALQSYWHPPFNHKRNWLQRSNKHRQADKPLSIKIQSVAEQHSSAALTIWSCHNNSALPNLVTEVTWIQIPQSCYSILYIHGSSFTDCSQNTMTNFLIAV